MSTSALLSTAIPVAPGCRGGDLRSICAAPDGVTAVFVPDVVNSSGAIKTHHSMPTVATDA
jgi:hypothetical protein